MSFNTQTLALISQGFFLVETHCKLNHTLSIVSTVDLNFLFLMLTADFWECRGFCCFSSCHSSAVLWYPTFCTSSQPPRFNNEWNTSAETCLSLYYFQGLCLFVLDIGGCAFFFSLFNIWLSYLLLLRIPFGVLLLSISRQRINIDHTVGLPRFLTEKPPPHLRPLLGPEPHLTVGPLLYLPLKFYLEHGRHNKGQKEENNGDEKPGGRERIN